jgi:hypothetical protein
MTLPKLSGEKRANLYNRANACRRANDYDRAMGIYESILSEDLTDAEAYWSIVLCKYGIEYVEDPKTRKRIPTCNRTRTVSVFADEDYRQAIVYASGEAKAFYEEEATAIDAIQKSILDISSREEPFDVFICYKETDDRGRRTPDSVIAQELYDELTDKGYKVFFARITLEDKLGEAYEPYIFAALNSARVMVVVGTRVEYFDSVWVKNEWSRYISLVRGGAKKTLIPAYKDMDTKDLPDEFVRLQAQNMDNLGFMQDLLRGIEKIIPKKETAPVASPFGGGTQGVVWRGTELNIDETSKTVTGIAGASGNCIVFPPEIEAIAPGAFRNIDEITSLVFEQGKLESIPEYAFAGCKNLKHVMFSDRIKSIGNNAFEDCAGIEDLSLPIAIKTIGDRAFAGCGALGNMYFGENLKSIGNEAFAGCNMLDQVILTNLETMGERVFADCPKLTKAYFTENVSHISRDAFAGCAALHDIMFNDCLKTVGESAFAGCASIKEMKFWNGMSTVEKNAFAGCTRLQSIIFPNGFERIEEGAFEGCVALEDITVSGKVSVAQGAFEGCLNIKNIIIEGERLESLLWLAPFFKNKTVSVTVSDDIKIIGEGAFRNCEFLTPIQIPPSAKDIGKNAFAGLACITKISVPNSVTVICEGAFSDCTRLKEISFDTRSRLLTIGDRAFAGCNQLKKIEIPDTVQSIGTDAFAGCDNLKAIYIAKYGTTGKLYSKKKIAINHPAVTFSHDDVVRVEKSAHTTITISPKARNIDEQAFRFYSGVKNVEIPSKVEHIGMEAFEGCTGLESVVFPENVKYISDRAFKDCTGLKNLVIPDTVIKICDDAFSGCTGLESVTVAGTVILCNGAFAECTALKEVIFTGLAENHMYANISAVFRNTPFLERYKLEQERRSKGLCIYCGGKLNLWGNKCKECGENSSHMSKNSSVSKQL